MAFETTNANTGNNDTGVPVVVHIVGTLLVITVFALSLEQACSISIDHELFRVRVGVLLSNALLCVLAIVINVDLLRVDGQIDFLDSDFVLIVRTLQIFWLFVAFLIGYGFVTDSINSAYKLSSKISSAALKYHQLQHIMSRKAPAWMSKLWALCVVVQEILLFILFIMAFVSQDILYFHICWISSLLNCVIGSLLVIVALIDIARYVYRTTKSNDDHNVNERNLNKLNRLLLIMIILCVLVIVLSAFNVTIIVSHLTQLSKQHVLHRTGSLKSKALDNVGDYLIYLCICIFVEIVFVFWTYKPAAVNYCTFCCYGYKKYTSNTSEFELDTSTMFYAFCKNCIDAAEFKRLQMFAIATQKEQIIRKTDAVKQPQSLREEEQLAEVITRPTYVSITEQEANRKETSDGVAIGITPALNDNILVSNEESL